MTYYVFYLFYEFVIDSLQMNPTNKKSRQKNFQHKPKKSHKLSEVSGKEQQPSAQPNANLNDANAIQAMYGKRKGLGFGDHM